MEKQDRRLALPLDTWTTAADDEISFEGSVCLWHVRMAFVPSALFSGQKCWKGGISPTRDLWWRDATVQMRSDRLGGRQMFVLAFASADGNDDRLHILSYF